MGWGASASKLQASRFARTSRGERRHRDRRLKFNDGDVLAPIAAFLHGHYPTSTVFRTRTWLHELPVDGRVIVFTHFGVVRECLRQLLPGPPPTAIPHCSECRRLSTFIGRGFCGLNRVVPLRSPGLPYGAMVHSKPVRLITIPYSHYCEKARWALDRAGVPYVEEGNLPIAAWAPAMLAGRNRTVPVLVARDETLPDSTEILHYCDRVGSAPPLFPDGALGVEVRQLEDEFDRHVGPQARRVAYDVLLRDRSAMQQLFRTRVPAWQSVAGPALVGPIAALIRRGLRIDPVNVRRSIDVLDATFASVAERLRDGRRYLAGDRFTAADLTFAALAVPVTFPHAYEAYLLPFADLPAAAREIVSRYRETPAGVFALRMYEQR